MGRCPEQLLGQLRAGSGAGALGPKGGPGGSGCQPRLRGFPLDGRCPPDRSSAHLPEPSVRGGTGESRRLGHGAGGLRVAGASGTGTSRHLELSSE